MYLAVAYHYNISVKLKIYFKVIANHHCIIFMMEFNDIKQASYTASCLCVISFKQRNQQTLFDLIQFYFLLFYLLCFYKSHMTIMSF